eukprot:TRINITY_DN36743_c0_g1_i1.p1 TRINITY_DN36743_c0_g1~~TRINITY_DN36743_c0_g1_i1.p1  ORF type:complete len:1377 (-),score=272.43 TRINITY_DN36743_c0_g1_i1:56-4186(-)
MGISGGNWDDDDEDRAKPQPIATFGLQEFVFDPGPVPTKAELTSQAEKKVRTDRDLKQALRRQKAAITEILQQCLDKVNGQLERGEATCQKAHFPLLNPIDFTDLEAFAQHDHFEVDLRVDKVDEALQQLTDSLIEVVWKNVEVENVSKAKSLERYNKAILDRMETLNHHLNDRSKQLSNCRYAYFLEITHLRNQLYIKSQEGDKFEAVEAYFFDPTEFLEEELRLLMNEKIKLSVKVYHDKVVTLKRRIADLELRLETAEALSDSRGLDQLPSYLQAACGKHGAKTVVAAMAELAQKEMQQWAAGWATSSGWLPAEGSGMGLSGDAPSLKNFEAMRQAMINAGQQAESEKMRVKQLEQELERLARASQEANSRAKAAEDRLEAAGLGGRDRTSSKGGSGANVMDKAAEMDELRKKVEFAKIQMEKEKGKTEAAEQRAADAEKRAKAAEERVKSLSQGSAAGRAGQGDSLSDEDREKLDDYEKSREAVAVAEEKYIGGRAPSSRQSLKSCIDRLTLGLQDRVERLAMLEGASQKLQKSVQDLRAENDELKARVDADGKRASVTAAQIEELRAARKVRQLEYAAAAPQEGPKEEELEDDGDADEHVYRPQTVGTRFAAPGGGFDCEVQTNITGHGSNFYHLEAPPTELEETIEAELEDLKACAETSWESALRAIRNAQRPPAGRGSGLASRGAFLRLFHGVRSRLARYEELVNMINSIRRAELQQVLEGVHFLMESTMPDEDLEMRDAIFGRGITQVMLNGHTDPLEFAALVKRWGRQLARIINIILKSHSSINLGVHPERRIFVPVLGAKPGNDGGTGGGLPARQRKDISPPRHRLYDNIGEAEDGGQGSPRLHRGDEEPRRKLMAVAGRSIVPFGNPGGITTVQNEPASPQQAVLLRRVMDRGGGVPDLVPESTSSSIMAGGRLVPRALNGTPSWQRSLPEMSKEEEEQEENDEKLQERAHTGPGLPYVQGGRPPATLERRPSPEQYHTASVSRNNSPEHVRQHSSSSRSPDRGRRRTVSPGKDIDLAAAMADAAHELEERHVEAMKLHEDQHGSFFDTQPTTAAGSTGLLRAEHTGSGSMHMHETMLGQQLQQEDLEAKSHVPLLYLPFGGAAAQEVEAKLMAHSVGVGAAFAAVRNARMGDADSEGTTLRRPGTASAPWRQAETNTGQRPGTAPAGQRTSSSGASAMSNWRPLTHGPAAADLERSLERERKRWCEMGGKATGPVPTWELEDAMDQKSRPVGGRPSVGSSASNRPDSAGRVAGARPLNRTASAGRIRPVGRANANKEVNRSSSATALSSSAVKRNELSASASQTCAASPGLGPAGTGLPPPRRWLPKPGAAAAAANAQGGDGDGSCVLGSLDVRPLSTVQVLRQ